MLQVGLSNVVDTPFPHVVSDAILPPELFARLKADFPDDRVFGTTAESSGSMGSRAGRDTGFDIYRGDPAYAELMRQSAAWREFDAWINSMDFVAKYQELFSPHAEALGLGIDIGASTYNRDYEEPREALAPPAASGSKVGKFVRKLTRGLSGGEPTRAQENRGGIELFSRLDITRALSGYAKPPHTDHGNRLCSLIIYFTDSEQSGLQGGDLRIYKLKQERGPREAPRHPRPHEVDIVAEVKPMPNRGVFFPCCNTSYHGVTAVTSQGVARDFLYINISGKAESIW